MKQVGNWRWFSVNRLPSPSLLSKEFIMNDNYYPKDKIILTEKEKQQFLAKLPSIVPIDAGIKMTSITLMI
jgi:hypothetical protein